MKTRFDGNFKKTNGPGLFWVGLFLFAFVFLPNTAKALNILVYVTSGGIGYPALTNGGDIKADLPPILQNGGVNTVTTIDVATLPVGIGGGTGAGILYCPSANSALPSPNGETWTSYDQVWDARFNDQGSNACPFNAATNAYEDYFAPCWQTAAQDYIQNHCGNFFMIGENSAFGSRDTGNAQFLNTIGATAGFANCNFSATNNDDDDTDTYVPTNLGFGGGFILDHAFGGIPAGEYNGTSYADWRGIAASNWNNAPGITRSVATFWSGAAQMTSLTGCNVGKLFTIWDTTEFNGGYYVTSATGTIQSGGTATKNAQNLCNEFFLGVVNLLGPGGTCSCTTNTPTNTATATSSQTPTNTATNTDTQTTTNTVTNTATQTSTQTPTNTATETPTNTTTNTETNTSTATSTQTTTNTFTATATNSSTNTATETATNTPTNTATNTSTNTTLFTATNTATNSSTNTATATATNTSTNTVTSTYTVTLTPTTFVTFGKSASETTAHAGDTITYDIAVTIGGGVPLTGVVITDTLPANVTFLSFATTTPASTTLFTPATDLLQWTFSAPMAPGVYNFTYQTQLNKLIVGNPTIINHAQLSYTGLAAPLNAAAPVTLIGQFTIKVNIYNSAGEIVKTIPIQEFSEPINSISLSTSDTITTLKGTGSSIDIIFEGVVIGTWDGTDNSNNPVSNGSYHIQVDSVGTSGVVTSVSQNAIVNRSLSKIEVDVYNSAGEVVRHLYEVVDDSSSAQMTNVSLSSNVIKPGSVSPGQPSTVQILAQTSVSPITVVWDGTADGGGWVTPGEYQVEVHWNNGSGSTTDITRTVLVLSNNGITGNVVARPNVLNAANGFTTTFDATGVQNAYSIKVNIYTIAGELVQSLTSAAGNPVEPWSPVGLASGIYLANVEVHNSNGGVINRQFVKVLYLH